MTSKLNRPARIIVGALPGEQQHAPIPRQRRIDYANLMRRTRTPEHHDTSHDEPQEQHEWHDDEPRAEQATLAERIGSVCVPIVDAVYKQQGQFIDLTARIAREVAQFCSNRAITGSGNWEVQMSLDPRILPDTTLYLALSPRCLELRFDTQDTSSRQLLLQHVRMLDRELTTLLEAWGEPREVDIAIW
jgi:type III secretion control protein HpaP